jgi:predicted nucleotidyltransferase
MQYETRNQIDEPILKVYQYGSSVYGCATDKSDSDYIVVVDSDDADLYYSVNEDGADFTVYSKPKFIKRLHDMHISVMECVFQTSNDPFLKHFIMDKEKLRREISAVSSNSFVKCKKKMRDGEDYIGRKSMFHSLRILMFGIQIAKHGRIVDYGCANDLLPIIMSLSGWEAIKAMCQPIYNELKSEFKLLAPLESDK